MKAIIAVACGVSCSIVLVLIGARLVPSHLGPTFYVQLPIILILSIPGPFVAGIIQKRNGWLIGAITIVILEILHAACLLLYVNSTISPSAAQTLRIYYIVTHEVQLYLCGGLTVLIAALVGSFGEKVGRGVKLAKKQNTQ